MLSEIGSNFILDQSKRTSLTTATTTKVSQDANPFVKNYARSHIATRQNLTTSGANMVQVNNLPRQTLLTSN